MTAPAGSRRACGRCLPAAALFGALLAQPAAAGDALDRSLELGGANNRQEQRTQQRIDELDEQTRRMLEEYQQLAREHDGLVAYNDQLERIVASQAEEKHSIERQLQEIDLTQREIVPLMLRMIDALERFVRTDIPFLVAERERRIAALRSLIDRADVTVAEKYRRVLEAYRVELDYGRTIEAYRDELEVDGARRTVDLLRVGRTGLYYLGLDGRHSGYWDARAGAWAPLSGGERLAVRQGLRVARQQVAPELLRIPVAAPREARP